ncbi:paramyosin-like [Dorcoceras hygrometricum]|uniref:Paramyosin-like n=1 Tax=Dorcoceras hygrometricum TaxID=472368 RepID=A0A2Z7DCK0_9LAMI|nr:paramyosin-like [Dorcoceras hygrometricum]
MSFVKANVIYDCYESITFDDQNSPKLSDNGKAGIGFQRPENSKPSWLKNKLDKDKAKAGSKFFVPNQPRRNSRKEKSGWTKAQPRRDLSGQKMKSKLNISHSNYAQTLTDTYTGKTVKDMTKKEEQVLYWGETESTRSALQRKGYILLKYREVLVRKFLESWKQNIVPGDGTSATDLKVIAMLSDLHLFVLVELKEQAIAHGLTWTKTCCSKIFEGHIRDRGAVIARNNTSTPSKCWIRTMIRVDGVWAVEPYASMHFDDHDTATTAFSRPVAATPDVTEALAQLQASIDQIRDRAGDAKLKDTLLMHLHGIDQRLTARLDDQDRVLGALRKDSYSQNQLLSLDIQSSHKHLSTQVAAAALDTVDVRRVAKELEAKVTSLEEQVAATRHDLLEFSAQAQQTLNVITDQLSKLIAYINRGGNDKKGEVVSSSRPQPPPDDQNRGSGNTGGGGDTDRNIVERLLTADRKRQ